MWEMKSGDYDTETTTRKSLDLLQTALIGAIIPSTGMVVSIRTTTKSHLPLRPVVPRCQNCELVCICGNADLLSAALPVHELVARMLEEKFNSVTCSSPRAFKMNTAGLVQGTNHPPGLFD